ncbi:MAG: hypothetical protein AABX04_07090 [Nanoarchaeota archaeon]
MALGLGRKLEEWEGFRIFMMKAKSGLTSNELKIVLRLIKDNQISNKEVLINVVARTAAHWIMLNTTEKNPLMRKANLQESYKYSDISRKIMALPESFWDIYHG